MKTAIIISKNNITGQMENEGEAILLNKMDTHNERSFWELRFLNNPDTTHCRWIENADIIESAE